MDPAELEKKRQAAKELQAKRAAEKRRAEQQTNQVSPSKVMRRDENFFRGNNNNNSYRPKFPSGNYRPNGNSQPNRYNSNQNNSRPSVEVVPASTSVNSRKKLKIDLVLVDSKHFRVISEWDDQLLAYMKKNCISSERQTYTFPLERVKDVMNDVRNMKHLDVTISETIPGFVVNLLNSFAKLPVEDIDLHDRIDTSTLDKLRYYQVEGIKFGISRGGKCFIADDMGLGKSVQSLCIMKWFESDWPLLIVCPKSLVQKWKEDIKLWLPSIKESDIQIPTSTKEVLLKKPITIMNYAYLNYLGEQFRVECFFRSMIFDESHNLKEASSQRTKIAMEITKFAQRIVLLSGTPVLNRPMELWTQFKMICDSFPTRTEFGNRYCIPKTVYVRGKPIVQYEGSTKEEELNLLMMNTFMIRRLKTEALKNSLPPKVREMSALEDIMDEESKVLMEQHKLKAKAILNSNKPKATNEILAYFKDSAQAKVPAVTKRIRELAHTKLKMLIFCHHRVMMDAIREVLLEEEVSHIMINGSTSTTDREDAVKQFQNKPNIRIALLSIQACNSGLNLTAANTVVFAELFWTPSTMLQAEDRVHRIGQTSRVRIIYLFAKNTIDEQLYKTLISKLVVLNKAGLTTDSKFDQMFEPIKVDPNQTSMDEYIDGFDDEDLDDLTELAEKYTPSQDKNEEISPE